MSYEKILKAALELPPHEQRGLVGHLYLKLQETGEDILSAEWLAEIQRRSDEIDQGKAKLLSLTDFKRFMDRLRKTARAKQ